MWDLFLKTLIEYWPVIVSLVGGLLGCILTYITTKLKAKTKEAELKTANLELRTAIINGSFILCPKCGEKIFLKDTKIYTKGE